MQGFFQIATFGVPREPEVTEDGDAALVDYALISRRSRDRAGLRYQRRGIDDDANVANFVETETIMRVEVNELIWKRVANIHNVLRSVKVSRTSSVMCKCEDQVGISLCYSGSSTDSILPSSAVLEPARIQFETYADSFPREVAGTKPRCTETSHATADSPLRAPCEFRRKL